MKSRLALLLVFLTSAVHSALPQDDIGITQHLNATLPLQSPFTDDDGRTHSLGWFFDGEPVIIVPGYYHCANLCSTVMDGVLESLAGIHLPGGGYRVLGLGIDPAETPVDAAHKKPLYAALIDHSGGELHLLTAQSPSITALLAAAGYRYAYDVTTRTYAHPAGFFVATPDGHISRYFMGVRFEPRELRLALVEASARHVGSLQDRIALLCSHFDPVAGRYSQALMIGVRALCTALALFLGWWLWRLHRTERPGP